MGAIRKFPFQVFSGWTWGTYQVLDKYDRSDLPVDWFRQVAEEMETRWTGTIEHGWLVGGSTRRAAEDAAALAFSRLPPERRAELLAGTAQGATT